jgi:hypothetical protein
VSCRSKIFETRAAGVYTKDMNSERFSLKDTQEFACSMQYIDASFCFAVHGYRCLRSAEEKVRGDTRTWAGLLG